MTGVCLFIRVTGDGETSTLTDGRKRFSNFLIGTVGALYKNSSCPFSATPLLMEPATHKRKATNTKATAPKLPSDTINYDGLAPIDMLGSGDSYYIPHLIEEPDLIMELLSSKITWLDVRYRGKIMHRKKQAFADTDSNGLIPLSLPRCLLRGCAVASSRALDSRRVSGVLQGREVTIGFHGDKPRDIDPRSEIWDISLGATRAITLLLNDGRRAQVIRLQPGSAFVLGPKTNAEWQHAVLAEPHVKEPRISLVYRSIVTRYDPKTNEIIEVDGVRKKRAKKSLLG